jgi:hypothetical protein
MTLPTHEFIRRFLMHVCPRASTASATMACSPTATEPPTWPVLASCSTWRPPQRHPRPWRRLPRASRASNHARAVAAACSSSRPSPAAASRSTGRNAHHRSAQATSHNATRKAAQWPSCLRPSLVHRQPRHQALRADRSAADGLPSHRSTVTALLRPNQSLILHRPGHHSRRGNSTPPPSPLASNPHRAALPSRLPHPPRFRALALVGRLPSAPATPASPLGRPTNLHRS